jgi:hypothetical protein
MSSLVAIGLGTMVLFGILTEELFEGTAVIFFRYSLLAGLTGLISSLQNPQPTRGLWMLQFFVTGVPVLAWRKLHLAGVWRSIFAFSISIVLFLNVVITSNVIVMQTPLSRSLPSTLLKSPLFVFQVLVMALSVALGRVAAKRFSSRRR